VSEENGRATAGLGARIGALRDHAGWSQPELAARAGVTKGTIWKLETGATTKPEPRTKRGLATAFGWPDYDTMVTSTALAPPAPAPHAEPAAQDELLTEMFNVLLGVRRDVRTLLERWQNGRAGANG
jgi:transcriptional regulator with XRE-family HTH domain